MLCLLIGNIMLIGIAAAAPMYSMATMSRMLHQDMRLIQAAENRFPAVSTVRFFFNEAEEGQSIDGYRNTRDVLMPNMLSALAVPVDRTIRSYNMDVWRMSPTIPRERNPRHRFVSLWGLEDSFENINLVHGRLPSHEMVDGHVIEALALDLTMFHQNLLYDELLTVDNIHFPHGQLQELYVHVVGIFEIPDEYMAFWSAVDISFERALLVSERVIFERFVLHYTTDYQITATWLNIHNYDAMSAARMPHYLSGIESTYEVFYGRDELYFSENYSHIIEAQAARAGEFSVTLLVLQIPLYLLLAFYVYVVNRKILQLEQNDISVLKSRGAGRKQIFGLYAAQGLFVGLVSFPIGIMFAVGICHILGASSGFLDFVRRTPLLVVLTPQSFLFGGIAFLFSFITLMLPVIGFSRVDITGHKRRKTGVATKAMWHRYYIDLILLGVAIIMIYNFNIQQEIVVANLLERDWIDPLLYVASSLFMIGFGLFCLRLFPYFIKLVFLAGQRFWPPSLYASLLRVSRSAKEEQFIMVFLVFTLAIGIFSAQSARTINLNAEHETRFVGGADLMFREHWFRNERMVAQGWADYFTYTEPSFERFTDFDEVDAMTRVLRDSVHIRSGEHDEFPWTDNVVLMGVEPRTFADTIWFRDDLMRIHINHYLNALSQTPNGVLLSQNFMDLGYRIGDAIDITHVYDGYVEVGTLDGSLVELPVFIVNEASAVVVGFVERWPTFVPVAYEVLTEYTELRLEQHLVVVNRGLLSSQWGQWPYEVWMRTNGSTNRFFYDFRDENNLQLTAFNDTLDNIVQARLDPLLQGTNGVLTVNFVIALLICFVGLLIYWILSIKERVLQFGIFRAMGMGIRGIFSILINEQFFITLTALAIGALVGEVSARLFVPLIQLAYTSHLIPLLIIRQAGDYANLYTVMGLMIALCLALLIVFVSRIRIDQALKLGED